MPWNVRFTIVPRRAASSTCAINAAPSSPTGASTGTAPASSVRMSGTTAPPVTLIATKSADSSDTYSPSPANVSPQGTVNVRNVAPSIT